MGGVVALRRPSSRRNRGQKNQRDDALKFGISITYAFRNNKENTIRLAKEKGVVYGCVAVSVVAGLPP